MYFCGGIAPAIDDTIWVQSRNLPYYEYIFWHIYSDLQEAPVYRIWLKSDLQHTITLSI